ncbi:hypothetical protein Vadar_028766 [Vaccinium darrowii]|uniref:Uncharacterized protein n=1 Tax=Vaccinium darrowii TaxID=229202 RepID=A0ACB7XCX1_9ERIC|nr:hypothetical protein Vadar_028766 [Vaccinium darrowii]
MDDGLVKLGSDSDIQQMFDLHEGGYDSDTDSDYRCSGLRDFSSSDESLVEEVNLECVVPHKEPNGNSDFVAEGGTSGNAVEEVGEGTSAKAVKEVGQVPSDKAMEEVGEGTNAKFVEKIGEDAILGDDEEDGNSVDSSDDNESLVNSSDDEKGKKKVKYPEFNEERDMKNPKLVEGTIFANVNAFRKLLKEFHIRNGCDYKYIKNESKRVTVKCKEPAEVGCKWRLHASRVGHTTNFQIKTITGEHTRGRKYQSRWASVEWLAKNYLDKLIDELDWKVTAMQHDVKRAWMLDVPQSQIYRAKRKGLIESMDLLFPEVEHRFCIRHIKDETVGRFSPEAHQWLSREPAKNWARCYYSPKAKINRMVNNISESFNNAIKKVRDKPIPTMLESMRRYIMQRKWDVLEIPCVHARASMIKDRANPEDFVHLYYLTETSKKSYDYLINPIPDRSTWPSSRYEEILHPPVRR